MRWLLRRYALINIATGTHPCSIRAKIIGGERPLLAEILDQSDRVEAKSLIFDLFARSDLAVTPSEKKLQLKRKVSEIWNLELVGRSCLGSGHDISTDGYAEIKKPFDEFKMQIKKLRMLFLHCIRSRTTLCEKLCGWNALRKSTLMLDICLKWVWTRCPAIAGRSRCRVRYSFRQK